MFHKGDNSSYRVNAIHTGGDVGSLYETSGAACGFRGIKT
jgi:hypothetical protein